MERRREFSGAELRQLLNAASPPDSCICQPPGGNEAEQPVVGTLGAYSGLHTGYSDTCPRV